MTPDDPYGDVNRRKFMQYLAMLGVGGRTLLQSGDARAAAYAAKGAAGDKAEWPKMSYRKLGRTGWNASRLVMGCGATLMFRQKDALLNAAYDAGINVFDVGYRGYYRNAEEHLAPFLKKVRDKVFLISKAPADLELEPNQIVTPGRIADDVVESSRQEAGFAALLLPAVAARRLEQPAAAGLLGFLVFWVEGAEGYATRQIPFFATGQKLRARLLPVAGEVELEGPLVEAPASGAGAAGFAI